MITYIVLGIIWYLVGIGSFVYWWTSQYDFTVEELPVALAVGIIGPFAFPGGWLVHGKPLFSNQDNVLIKKR